MNETDPAKIQRELGCGRMTALKIAEENVKEKKQLSMNEYNIMANTPKTKGVKNYRYGLYNIKFQIKRGKAILDAENQAILNELNNTGYRTPVDLMHEWNMRNCTW